ncbi:ATP-dependent DNA helicase RecG [Rhodococcus opacus]|uniref:ATP-dependent DNA helicase RecG n=1 Tax=Rhodococcus opacus TaxID=37919 RepID=UPI0002DE5FCC|nr:ATP-dependent DNA helicase RecG [Rhodococcus opacus]MDX5962708.1 ATP-dependent DNA helicase RecG [Rhodococcus opacus]
MIAAEQVDTLRAAVIALHESGSATAILSAAARSAQWHPAVVERVRAQLPAFADQLGALGFDVRQVISPAVRVAEPPAAVAAPRTVFGAGPARVPLDPALRAGNGAKSAVFGVGPAAAGTDPALQRGTPKPQCTRSVDRPRHDVEIPTIPTLSAAAVLGQRSHKPPLEFEGTLDGLRGAPIDDLAGIRDDAGVGDKELERLTAAGIATVYDLMMRVPLRYIDRSEITPMGALRPGMKNVATVGKVLSTKADWGKKYARIEIGAGSYRVTSMQFQQPWMAQRFRRDDLVLMWGDVTEWEGFIQMAGALIAPMRDATAPFVPVYPQSDKHQVSTWTLHRAALDALRRLPALDDPLPQQIRTTRQLPGRLEALRAVHVPDNAADATSGRDRLAYDELLRMQLAMGVQRNAARQQPAVVHAPTGRLTRPWLESLPWPLTGAQNRVLKEIAEDLRSPSPMKRLLQGDVGSGKTKVAICAMLMAAEGGHQAALMAPIGVLVQQHYEEIAETCEKLGLRAVLVPGKNKPKARREALTGLASGEIHIAVGTTGLLSDDVQFKSLGLVVIDEQHRFGVNQRAALLAKGPGGAIADELGATATPIPRTAAMTQFGDVDISILDELPPGRTPIRTRWEPVVSLDDPNHAHWAFVRTQIAEGRQAFVVCPLVAEPETKAGQESEAQSAAAMETATALADGALSGLRIAVVTGRQKPADRAETMYAFTVGELDVLVATTVIEVGVSVPNATTITILDAGNFGLAQLHQLRGRVGRGKHPGFCVLTGEVSDIGQARMDAMCETTDGFKLANVDLELRGPGALAGTAQAGHRAGLLVADLLADADLMHAARADAQQMLTTDPQLLRRPTLRAEVERALGDDAHYLRRS